MIEVKKSFDIKKMRKKKNRMATRSLISLLRPFLTQRYSSSMDKK
jgi:hypothetical protein